MARAPPAKRFFCVNRGPFDAEVAFTPWLNPVPGDVSAYCAGGDGGDAVRVSEARAG